MSEIDRSGNVSASYLHEVFGDQFQYISPWVMAGNMLLYAPRENVHVPHHRHFARTKALVERTQEGHEVKMWLERESDHAQVVHLRGFTQIYDYQSQFQIAITEEGAFDVNGKLVDAQERQLVSLLHRLMQPDDPNIPID